MLDVVLVESGVFKLVDFYLHFDWPQPAFEEAQQQAAAAGGHYASEAQATPRVDVGDPLEASSLNSATIMEPMPGCSCGDINGAGRCVSHWP